MSAIILDGHLKSALAAARSLGRKGVKISAGGVRSSGMVLHSRYVQNRFVYPSPKEEPQRFLESILAVAKKTFEKGLRR